MNEIKVATTYKARIVEGQPVYRSLEAAKIAGIEKNEFLSWQKLGYMPDGMKVQIGTTIRNVFVRREIYQMRGYAYLIRQGLTLSMAKRICDEVAAEPNQQYFFAVIAAFEDEGLTFVEPGTLDSLKTNAATAIFLNMAMIRQEVDLLIEQGHYLDAIPAGGADIED